MSAPAPAEAQALLTALTRALAGVAVLALIFTAVNVTLFATSRGVTPAIAVLLDPMVALALAAILYADARLAAWGIRPPHWSAALRWFTAITATLMNTWGSIWPDRQIGTPIHADPAGCRPARRTDRPADPAHRNHRRLPADRRPAPRPDQLHRSHARPRSEQAPPIRRTGHALRPVGITGTGPKRGHRRRWAPHCRQSARHTPGAPIAPDGLAGAIDATLWAHAVAIDDSVRTATGRPVSVWRLRSELHLGPDRAKQIHTQLLKRGDGAPPLS